MIPKRQECRLAIPESSKTFIPLFLEDLEGRTGRRSTQSYCSCATCALLLTLYNTHGKETGNYEALDPSDV